jgi:hypothetical protein
LRSEHGDAAVGVDAAALGANPRPRAKVMKAAVISSGATKLRLKRQCVEHVRLSERSPWCRNLLADDFQ